jgi:hypothetical protein
VSTAPPSPPTTAPGGGVAGPADPASAAPAPEVCPLCAAPLRPDQEWCLHCGAAARTRLATTSNWKTPIIAVAVVVTLSLGVLAASLVALAGDSGPTTTAVVKITTTAPAATAPTTTTAAPAPTTPTATTPAASTPTATTTTPAPGATGKTEPGAAGTGVIGLSPALKAQLVRLEATERNSPSAALKKNLRPIIEQLRARNK